MRAEAVTVMVNDVRLCKLCNAQPADDYTGGVCEVCSDLHLLTKAIERVQDHADRGRLNLLQSARNALGVAAADTSHALRMRATADG